MAERPAQKSPETYREQQRELRQSPVRLPIALLVALVVHLLATPLVISLFKGGENPPKKVTKVHMVPIAGDGRIARPNMQKQDVATAKPLDRPPEQEKKPEEKVKPQDIKGQIVDLPPSKDDTPPDQAKYLSEHNTRTDKETVSKYQSKDYQNAENLPTVTHKSEGLASPQEGGNPNILEIGPDSAKTDKKLAQKKQDAKAARAPQLEFPKISQTDKLALAVDPKMGTLANHEQKEALNGNGTKLRIAPGQQGQEAAAEPGRSPKPGKAIADFIPTMGQLSRIAGAPANDYLNEQQGEGTFLNSREFKYAGFFNRMKRGVSSHWNPVAEYQRRDPTGNVYGTSTRTTLLTVTLTPDGKLKDAVVSRSSGLDFLDAEAIQAFRRAEPFSNPPPALVENGVISFNFGFTLEFNGSGGLGRF